MKNLMWKQRETPLRIEKRFEFDKYSRISKFMEYIDLLSKEKNIYQNISFGKNFVSITIFSESEELSELEKEFSSQIDKYFLDV